MLNKLKILLIIFLIPCISIHAMGTSGNIYDDTCAEWTFAGSWTSYNNGLPYGGSEHFTNTLNDTASISFSGSGFIFLYSADTNRSNVQIIVDGW